MGEQREKTPAEFTKDMPEDAPQHGSDAGPGAPETVEPRSGRPGNAGKGPDGEAPGGAAPQRQGADDGEEPVTEADESPSKRNPGDLDPESTD